jgi:DNA-binding beta-propeller fold protein YncE
MEKDQDSVRDPLSLQESRNQRRARLVRKRRQAAIGILIALVVVAGGGYAGYVLATRDDATSVASTTTQQSADSTVPATGESTGTSGSTTTVLLPNLAAQPLEITADPEVVNLTITLQDGTTVTGKTPFSEDVPGGAIQIRFAKKGYNEAVRPLTLDTPASLKVWLDPTGQLVESLVRFKCGSGPQQVAFSPDGRELWIALLDGDGLEVYSPTNGAKTGEVSLGSPGTADLVFSKDGATLYAVNMKTNTVYEIDRVSRTVKRRLATEGETPKALVISLDGTTVYTANWGTNDISQIDLASGTVARRLPTVKAPRGLYLTSDGLRLYVAGYADGELQRIDLQTGEGTLVFKSGGSLWAMAGDDFRGMLYVDDNALGTVYAMDLTTEVTTNLAGTDKRPNTLRVASAGRLLCVANRGKEDSANSAHAGPEWGSILLVDTAGHTVLDAIVGGNQCTALDVSADGTLLAFSDFFDDRIRVYRVPAYETLAAGNGGRAIERFTDIVKK